MTIKGPQIYRTDRTKNSQHPYYGQVPDYSVPEANTPAIFDSHPRDIVYGQVKPTAEEAAGAGTAPNPPTGQYPPSPEPRNDAEAGAVMPKLQVQGKVRDAYGKRLQPFEKKIP